MKKGHTGALITIVTLLVNIHTIYAQGWQFGKVCNCDGSDGWAVATDGKGAVYMAGVYSGLYTPVSFSRIRAPLPLSAYWQTVWAKFDLNGNIQWIDGTHSGDTYIENITTDPAGNLIIFGSFTSRTMQIGPFILYNAYAGGATQYFLAKINPAGTVLWAVNDGNIFYQYLTIIKLIFSVGGVTTDTAGNIYITSSFNEPTMSIGSTKLINSDPSGKTYDIFVAKYTPSGTPVWATSVGGMRDDYALGITAPPNGNVYISGTFYSPSIPVGPVTLTNPYSQNIACIAKFSAPSGKPLWAQSAGGRQGAIAIGIISDVNSNVYLTGSFSDTSITFGSSSYTRPFPASFPSFASFLIQYSPSDVVTWGKCLGSPKKDVYCYSVALASCGQVWVAGAYSEDVLIAPGDTLLRVSGSDPVFIAGYNLAGGTAGYSGVGAGGDDQVNIASDALGNIYLCGDNSSAITIGHDVLPPVIYEAMFIAKYANSIPQDTTIGKDTTFCTGSGSALTTLTATNGYATYYWNDGAYSQTHTVTAPGIYYVFDATCGKPVKVDTFNIVPLPVSIATRSNDTSACITSGVITLSGPLNYSSWLWNTGNASRSIRVVTAGAYWVSSMEACTRYVDTFNVTSIDKFININLGNDTSFCTGNTYTLTSLQPKGYSYLWSNGSTDSSISITESGLYRLMVSTKACYGTDSIQVNVASPPFPINLGPDTSLCMGRTVVLSVSPQAYTSFLWSTNANEKTIAVNGSGNYWILSSNVCGSLSDTINVDFKNCDIWLPSAFTPNGDGMNDILRALGQFNFITKFSLSIYNRYGQRVYYSEDLYAGWDGNFNGSKQDLGTYFYVMDYTLEGEKQMLKGDIELIR